MATQKAHPKDSEDPSKEETLKDPLKDLEELSRVETHKDPLRDPRREVSREVSREVLGVHFSRGHHRVITRSSLHKDPLKNLAPLKDLVPLKEVSSKVLGACSSRGHLREGLNRAALEGSLEDRPIDVLGGGKRPTLPSFPTLR